jgi:CHAT domain-containing protein
LALREKEPNSDAAQGACHCLIGSTLLKLERYEEAITEQEKSVAIFEKLPGSEREQATCWGILAEARRKIALRRQDEAVARSSSQAQSSPEVPEKPSPALNEAMVLFLLGRTAYNADNMPDAIGAWTKALRIYQGIEGTELVQADCYNNIGAVLERIGRHEESLAKRRESLAKYDEALRVYQGGKGKEVEQALCYRNVDSLLKKMGKYAEAIARQEEALRFYRRIKGTERDQADCYKSIGGSLGCMGKYEESIAKEEEALRIYRTIKGTMRLQADCQGNIGMAFDKMGNYQEAVDRYGQALASYQEIRGTEREQARCHSDIGLALGVMGNYDEAIARQEQAIRIYKGIPGTLRERAKCHKIVGEGLIDIGRYKEGIARIEEAMRLFQTITGTEREQADCYRQAGAAGHYMSGPEEVIIGCEDEALRIYERIPGTERERADCHRITGAVLLSLGKYQEGIARQKEALRIFQTIRGTELLQAACHVNIGVALHDMGEYEEEIAELKESILVYRTVKRGARGEIRCYLNMGRALEQLGKHDDAIASQEEALRVCKRIPGTEQEQEYCHGDIGEAYLGAGRFSEAIASYQRAGAGWWIHSGLALAYHARGSSGDDLKAVKQSWLAVESAEQCRKEVIAFEHRTGIFEQPARVFPGFVYLVMDLAAKKTDVGRSSEELRGTAFEISDRGKGRALVDALREHAAVRATRPDGKLLAEDKELSLGISKLASLREPLPDADERRKKLTEDIDSLQQRRNMIEVELKKTALGGYVAPDFRKPMEMAKELEPDAAVLQYSVGEKQGWLLILTREGITAHKLGADTQALPELLPRQEATLDQLVEALKTRGKKIGLDGLVRLARARAEDLGRRESERHNSISANLEKAILKRLAEVVLPEAALAELRKKGIHRLLVIPDGSLHYIPFAMLRLKNEKDEDTHYLVEEFASSYIPAMTTLDTIRKQKQERQRKRMMERRLLLAFANPAYGTETAAAAIAKDDMLTRVRAFRTDYYKGGGLRLTSLPETEQEAIRVAALFAPPRTYSRLTADEPEGEAVVFTGHGAGEEQVKRLLGVAADAKAHRQWQYLLFSTHGLADTHNGMLSCLALSSPAPDSEEDGFLQAQEVMNLELDTELVMLSACQTGLGRLRGGEGLVGLSTAFFYAGAESVCASLWQVPSGPTSQLVPELFKQLKEGKVDRAEALRQAQLAVMRQGQGRDGKSTDYSSPFCWAAFVMMGECRQSQ